MVGSRGLIFASLIIVLLLGVLIEGYFISSKVEDKCQVRVVKEVVSLASPSAMVAPVVATPKTLKVIPTVVK